MTYEEGGGIEDGLFMNGMVGDLVRGGGAGGGGHLFLRNSLENLQILVLRKG